jgi:hypothetical protein
MKRKLVYFIEAEGCSQIKIGHSTDPEQRLKILQVGHPGQLRILLTMNGGEAMEKALHARFAHLRVRGECLT